MRWILFILFCLLGAPAHAVSIPGVTTTTTTDSTTEPAPEPDIEQKKAAYGALADVLDNDPGSTFKGRTDELSDEYQKCGEGKWMQRGHGSCPVTVSSMAFWLNPRD